MMQMICINANERYTPSNFKITKRQQLYSHTGSDNNGGDGIPASNG